MICTQQAVVESKTAAGNTKTNDHNAGMAACADSTFDPKGVVNAGKQNERLLLAKDLKEEISFRALLEADGHVFKKSGNWSTCRCPFHNDRNPSFGIPEDDDTGRCFACGWYGDIFAYEEAFHHVNFKTAWLRLNDFFYACPRAGRKAKAPLAKKAQSICLSPKQLAERTAYCNRLATDRWIAERIISLRANCSWKSETLQALAKEGALGWAGDALAFLYPTGTKYRRWPTKDFYWECEGLSLWRQPVLKTAKHVYLTESETDAIALVDAGIDDDPEVAVIAAPSATTFKADWAPQFAGKKVTLCFDNDEAGQNGAERVAAHLEPLVPELFVIDWKEARK